MDCSRIRFLVPFLEVLEDDAAAKKPTEVGTPSGEAKKGSRQFFGCFQTLVKVLNKI
jgi:hypothetical protein